MNGSFQNKMAVNFIIYSVDAARQSFLSFNLSSLWLFTFTEPSLCSSMHILTHWQPNECTTGQKVKHLLDYVWFKLWGTSDDVNTGNNKVNIPLMDCGILLHKLFGPVGLFTAFSKFGSPQHGPRFLFFCSMLLNRITTVWRTLENPRVLIRDRKNTGINKAKTRCLRLFRIKLQLSLALYNTFPQY